MQTQGHFAASISGYGTHVRAMAGMLVASGSGSTVDGPAAGSRRLPGSASTVSCVRRVAYWEGRIVTLCMRGPSDVVSSPLDPLARGASDVLRHLCLSFGVVLYASRHLPLFLQNRESLGSRIADRWDERTTMSPSSLSPGQSPSPGQTTSGLPKPKPKVRSSLPRPRTSSTAGLRTPATPAGRTPPTPGTPATPTLRKPPSMRGTLGLAKSPSLTKLATGAPAPKTPRVTKHVRQRSSLSALSAVDTSSTPQSRTHSIDLTDVRKHQQAALTCRSSSRQRRMLIHGSSRWSSSTRRRSRT